MSAESFITDVLADARAASARTGVPTSVVLAQWGDETGFGTSRAWTQGHNYAGLSPGGHVADYPSRQLGLAAYIATLLKPAYAPVRSAGSPQGAAAALGASPWAASHYGGGGRDLLGIIDRYDLTRFDDPAAANASGAVSATPVLDVPDPFGIGGKAADAITGVLGKLVAPLRNIALTSVFVAGGAVLVVAGVVHAVAPRVRAKVAEGTDQAGKAMTLAAMA